MGQLKMMGTIMLLLIVFSSHILTSFGEIPNPYQDQAPPGYKNTCGDCEKYLNAYCCKREPRVIKPDKTNTFCCDFPDKDGGQPEPEPEPEKPKQVGERCGEGHGICDTGLVCKTWHRIINSNFTSNSNGKMVKIVNDMKKERPWSVCVKKEDVEECKMAGESCGHHAGVANGTKFDGQCCTGHLCAYPPPPWGDKGVMGKCVEIVSTCAEKECGASCTTGDGTKGMCNDQQICEEQIVSCPWPEVLWDIFTSINIDPSLGTTSSCLTQWPGYSTVEDQWHAVCERCFIKFKIDVTNIKIKLDEENLKVNIHIRTYGVSSKDHIVTQMDTKQTEIQSQLQSEVNNLDPEQKCNVKGISPPVANPGPNPGDPLRQLGETCGLSIGWCADGLVCSPKSRIITTEYKNNTSGKSVSFVNDKVGDVQATCVKKEDIEVCKRNGESCGHHRGIMEDNGEMVPSKFDGHCCEGSVCRYPTLGVVGKCIDEDSTCQTCGEMCKIPDGKGGRAGVCNHKYKCVLKPTNPDEPICKTYDEKCCRDHGMTEECMVLCRDERFRKGLLRQGPRPPRPCDKFESISDKCLISIPPKDALNPLIDHSNKSIAETAAATPALSTLLAAVKAAGLAPTLSGKGDFTVFAPTNDAFAKLPEGTIPSLLKPENKQQLADILLRHVLPTRIMAGDIPSGTTKVKTVGGEEIEVINNGSGVSIKSSAGTANVIATDIMTSNGVVHLVDTVF